MAAGGWLEIEYPVTDPVINPSRIGTDDTVILHASEASQSYEAQSHVARAGVLSEVIHIVTLDVITVSVPQILPGVGLDERGRSRSQNVRELLRALLRGRSVTIRPHGETYLVRIPQPLSAKLEGNTASLDPVDQLDYFSLSLRFRQHGYATSDF